MTKNDDYSMSSHDAKELQGVIMLPFDIRRRAIAKYAAEHGKDALIDLFANFIGMANAVVNNTREWLELQTIIHADMHPHEAEKIAEKINSSTLFGALQGVELANQVNQKKTCVGCAFRLGSAANQSPCTTTDADSSLRGDDGPFMCHEHLDESGEPTRVCGGYSQLKRRQLHGAK